MAEDFSSVDIQKLFHNKFIIVIGDSVMRGAYKDLVHFLQYDSYITRGVLKRKGEESTNGDVLIEGGMLGEMTNQTHYREIRQYKTDTVLIRFYFVTQVYNKYFETIVEDLLHESSPEPDVIMMNSCLWDMSRYGPRWLQLYRDNLDKMLDAVKTAAKDTLFMWLTCMPVGKAARGGFLPRGIEWKKDTLRLDVLEANFFAKQAVQFHGFDCVDLNYNFRQLTHLRAEDDIHWVPSAHRKMTCIILDHISAAWGVPRPRRMKPLPRNLSRPLMSSEFRRHRRTMTTPAAFQCVPHNFLRDPGMRMMRAGMRDMNNNQMNIHELREMRMMKNQMSRMSPLMFDDNNNNNSNGNWMDASNNNEQQMMLLMQNQFQDFSQPMRDSSNNNNNNNNMMNMNSMNMRNVNMNRMANMSCPPNWGGNFNMAFGNGGNGRNQFVMRRNRSRNGPY